MLYIFQFESMVEIALCENQFLITPNYISEILQENPKLELSLDSLFILRCFTQFTARIYEQALLSHYKPRLNGGYTVVFPFVN